jgi:hypothetical protein
MNELVAAHQKTTYCTFILAHQQVRRKANQYKLAQLKKHFVNGKQLVHAEEAKFDAL